MAMAVKGLSKFGSGSVEHKLCSFWPVYFIVALKLSNCSSKHPLTDRDNNNKTVSAVEPGFFCSQSQFNSNLSTCHDSAIDCCKKPHLVTLLFVNLEL